MEKTKNFLNNQNYVCSEKWKKEIIFTFSYYLFHYKRNYHIIYTVSYMFVFSLLKQEGLYFHLFIYFLWFYWFWLLNVKANWWKINNILWYKSLFIIIILVLPLIQLFIPFWIFYIFWLNRFINLNIRNINTYTLILLKPMKNIKLFQFKNLEDNYANNEYYEIIKK